MSKTTEAELRSTIENLKTRLAALEIKSNPPKPLRRCCGFADCTKCALIE